MPSMNDAPQYSPWTGLVYVFNLIVGTGALTLPAAFSKAGWALGLGFIILLAVISFMTVTFVIEAMSIANAIMNSRKREMSESTDLADPIRPLLSSRRQRERDPLIPPEYGNHSEEIRIQNSTMAVFEITQRVEMGGMAAMFFSRCGLYLFYVCICIYLYGDLAIYITAVAKSVRDVVCTYQIAENSTITNSTIVPLDGDDFCWSEDDGMTRFAAYRLFSVIFIVVLGPFCFFNVSKTKYLQVITTLMRWTAFLIMIGIASTRLIENKGTGHPIPANPSAIPNLFGVCVYSFMCHHSLPSLVTPISKKKNLLALFSADYLLITVFYLLLALTGVFAYDHIQDLYTLNFVPSRISTDNPVSIFTLIVQYFLSLFPVFTLSTSFPIIAITLRNNLKALFDVVDEEDEDLEDSLVSGHSGVHAYNSVHVRRRRNAPTAFCKFLSKCGFPIMAILPPFLVAMFLENVQALVTITGSYAGAGIQYIIPIFLVFHARKRYLCVANPHASPFKHVAWLWFVLIWAVVAISFVTINFFFGDELL